MTGDSARLGLALCASVWAHVWLLAAHPGAPLVRPSSLPAWTSINARIAAVPTKNAEAAAEDSVVAPRTLPVQREITANALPGARTLPAEVAGPIAARRSNPPLGLEKPGSVPNSPRLPAAVDTTWYAAHELDSYPRALAPIRLEYSGLRGSVNASARLLVWLRIDERGEVVDVSAGEIATPGHWLEAARASLATVRFTPARKDERAVRSRLLLSIDFAPPSER